jgi:hypothetical protein
VWTNSDAEIFEIPGHVWTVNCRGPWIDAIHAAIIFIAVFADAAYAPHLFAKIIGRSFLGAEARGSAEVAGGEVGNVFAAGVFLLRLETLRSDASRAFVSHALNPRSKRRRPLARCQRVPLGAAKTAGPETAFAPSTAAFGRQRGPERSGGRRRAAILLREEFGGAEGENRWLEPLRARVARLERTKPRGCAGVGAAS